MLAVLFLRCVILPLKFAFQFDYSGVVLSPFVENWFAHFSVGALLLTFCPFLFLFVCNRSLFSCSTLIIQEIMQEKTLLWLYNNKVVLSLFWTPTVCAVLIYFFQLWRLQHLVAFVEHCPGRRNIFFPFRVLVLIFLAFGQYRPNAYKCLL